MVARLGAGLLLLACACSNDTFVGSEDAASDATSDVEPFDAAQPGDAIALEGSTGGYCALHAEAFFCDDWDDPQETSAWIKWSFPTPANPAGAIDFGNGVTARGVVVKAGAVATAYLTRQTQNDALHGLVFDMKIENVTASTTYVRIQAESKTFTIATDLGSNLTVTGDSGGAQTLTAANTTWHHYEVTFQNQNATVTQDNGAHATTVGFSPQAPTSSMLAVGIVTGTLGGTVYFDDLLLR